MSLVAITTSTLIAATSPPSPSSSSQSHMLYYHEASSPGQDQGGDENGECKLLGSFSLLVQAALGALALLSLVYKRWRERPQRQVKVWAFDVSKQVFGSTMLHMANLLISMFSAGQLDIQSTYRPNPCSFYLLNLGIDTTLGIPILILNLRILNFLASYTPLANPPESIESGNYGHPPRATWWLKQSIIYFMGLFSMKICVFFLIQLLPFIIKVGDWALRWTEGNTALQIAFVMLLFPLIMNALQYYIIDSFIKKQLSFDLYTESDSVDNPDDLHRREALLAGLDEAYSTDSGDEESAHGKDTPSHAKAVANALHGSEGQLTEDHSPVPPYEPFSSGSSRSEQGGKPNADT
ncbi:uncharacterized protein N7498_008633 [Penicillium cinerascens]|uniref:Vacuolar membrane protein n=1 Tax=Penicillium cinerascens TaxID=70096 RepID=A0A9W9JHW3_9EURO|nr:uncharacterized protein N7498_008633 [Penicillium cinerascens]KAJ5195195.1 hypothetical protein N7498_008633 [Penicillium cinerascens]